MVGSTGGVCGGAVGLAVDRRGKVMAMRRRRVIGLLLVIGWLGLPLGAEATRPAPSCSSVFIESLQEYRTVCSNGAYYRTYSRQIFKDWEMQQMYPSGPHKPPPLYR